MIPIFLNYEKCKEYKLKYFPWRWGDRRMVGDRNITPISILESYFSPKRDTNLFQETIPIDNIEAFIKEHKIDARLVSYARDIAAAVRLFSNVLN